MSTPDREREQFEALVAAYRQLPRAEPPAERDRAVLEAARAAVSKQRASRPGWPAMLGTAATLVLAFGLAWQIRDRELRVPAPAGQDSASPVATAVVPDQPTAAAAKPAPSNEHVDTRGMPPQEGEARKQEATEALSAKADDARGAGGQRERRVNTGPVAAPAAVRAPPAAPPPPPAPAQDLRTEDALRIEEEKAEPKAVLDDGTARQSVPAPAVAEPFPQDRRAPAVPAEQAAADPPVAPTASADSPAGAPARASGQDAGGLFKRPGTEAARMTPEAWLADIRRLLRQGQRERAGERLAAFRAAYPDASVPEDLRDLVP